MERTPSTLGLFVTLVVAGAPGPASALEPDRGPVASVELAGTMLVVEPGIEFTVAHLHITGPDDYQVCRDFSPGSPVTVDLLTAPAPSALDVSGEDHRSDTGRRPALPDGRYRWEMIFPGTARQPRATGRFAVLEGRPYLSPSSKGALDAAAGSAGQLAPETPPALTENEQLILLDNNDNGLTLIELQADNSSGNPLEYWQIRNSQGDFHIVEDGAGSQNDVRFSIVQDDEGKIGIGTTAPATNLHLLRDSALRPGIQLEHVTPEGSHRWSVFAGEDGLSITRVVAGSPIVKIPLRIEPFAKRLTLDATGMHIQGDARISGPAEISGDLSVLSSRDAKENFTPVDVRAVLARVAELPILEWSYRGESPTRHLGPLAEDFRSQFALGRSPKSVNPLDLAGVALAAIQGLSQALAEERAETGRLQRETEELRERVLALERGASGRP